MNKPIIVTGVTGSGKTEFCVNLALRLREETQEKIYIADLDVVNLYFRSREKREYLERLGIEIVGDATPENTDRDIPSVSFGFLPLIEKGERVILDLAGGKVGLNLLASCYESMAAYEFLCVLNLYRKETNTEEKMVRFIEEIHRAGKCRVTGLVNNSHMLHHTGPEHVLQGQEAVLRVSRTLGIPLVCTQVNAHIFQQIQDEIQSEDVLVFQRLQMRKDWQ